jgi:hypothetical protein
MSAKLKALAPSARKVGGIWFFKVGRMRLSFCRARKVGVEA